MVRWAQPPASAGWRRLHRRRAAGRSFFIGHAFAAATTALGLPGRRLPDRPVATEHPAPMWRGEHWSTDISASFSDLGASAEVVTHFANRGITSAFPIQEQAIPPALEGRDVS